MEKGSDVEEAERAERYVYEEQKARIFTEDGVKTLLSLRDRVHSFLGETGAFRVDEALGIEGDTYLLCAIIEFLAEIGEIKAAAEGPDLNFQDHVFVRGKSRPG